MEERTSLQHSPAPTDPAEEIPDVYQRGYVWKVVHDPTRHGYEPGMFYGGLFRMMDLHLERDERSTWPEGTVFEHVLTGARIIFQGGRLLNTEGRPVHAGPLRVRRGRRGKRRQRAAARTLALRPPPERQGGPSGEEPGE